MAVEGDALGTARPKRQRGPSGGDLRLEKLLEEHARVGDLLRALLVGASEERRDVVLERRQAARLEHHDLSSVTSGRVKLSDGAGGTLPGLRQQSL